MRKLDLILENIRDDYMINLLEEGSATELETLKTKKFLNENLNRVRSMLVEEGAMDAVKGHLANNWGKYLAGAGTAAGMAAGADGINDIVDQGQETIANYKGDYPIAQAAGVVGGGVVQAGADAANAVVDGTIDLFNAAGEKVNQFGQTIGDAYGRADYAAGGMLPGGQSPDQVAAAKADDATQATQGYQ